MALARIDMLHLLCLPLAARSARVRTSFREGGSKVDGSGKWRLEALRSASGGSDPLTSLERQVVP